MITGRSDRDMYINERKQLGKDGFMDTWQLSEIGITLVIKKSSESQYQRCGHDKRRQEESGKVEDRSYRKCFHG